MYNKCIFVGRMVRDPEIRTVGDSNVCNFTIAVDRAYKDKDGNRKCDFIDCVVWRGTADFVGKYFQKGSPIVVDGELHIDKYTNKDGADAWRTSVSVDRVGFAGSKNSNDYSGDNNETESDNNNDSNANTPDDDLPF